MNNITKTSMGPLHRTWRIYLGIMVEWRTETIYYLRVSSLMPSSSFLCRQARNCNVNTSYLL
jgi:hypothetical protein